MGNICNCIYPVVGSNFYRTMRTTEIITFDELTDKIESLMADDKFRTCGEFLLTAINDWPTMNLKEPKDLMDELKNEIKKSLTCVLYSLLKIIKIKTWYTMYPMLLIKAAALIPYMGIKILSPAIITTSASNEPVIFTFILFLPA